MKFKPEDFLAIVDCMNADRKWCSTIANEVNNILEQRVGYAEIVYGMMPEGMPHLFGGDRPGPRDTHKGLLIKIEEL